MEGGAALTFSTHTRPSRGLCADPTPTYDRALAQDARRTEGEAKLGGARTARREHSRDPHALPSHVEEGLHERGGLVARTDDDIDILDVAEREVCRRPRKHRLARFDPKV